jgi:hypothetical protein
MPCVYLPGPAPAVTVANNMDTVLILTISNAVNVQSTDIGKQDIYRRKD